MKIGILTLPLGHNYGGVIQAYSLYRVISDHGHEVEIINYRGKYHLSWFKIFKRLIKKIFGKQKSPINIEEVAFKNTIDFLSNKSTLSEELSNKSSVYKYIRKHSFDAIIVGSDQVWRKEYTKDLSLFFLDFETPNIKKIAYAASFGGSDLDYNDNEKILIKNLISEFYFVSTREESAKHVIENTFNINCSWVCDPTALLGKEDYLELIGDTDCKSPGIFTYILDKDDFKKEVIQKVSIETSLSPFTCQPVFKHYDDTSRNPNDYILPTIEKWLASFLYSDLVITDSFHGVMLSLILNKPFIYFTNKSRGNERFESIDKVQNIKGRLVSSIKDLENIINNGLLFTPSHNDKLKSFSENSFQKIIKAIEDE